ncbi:putative glutamine transport system permease protein [Streptococcus pneumoniae]|nr:putative glutamine transport system permease protein [Streptococcus pneumoniae]
MHSYIKYLTQEDPIITDEGKQIEILHLDIQDDPEIFEDWAKQFRRNYCSDDELAEMIGFMNPNHSYLSQLDVTYKTPDLMSHFLPPHEVSFTFCCSSIVFPR